MKKSFVIIFLLLFFNLLFAQKEPFSLETIYKVKSLSAPLISPDGKYFVYQTTEFFFPEAKSKRTLKLYDLLNKNEKAIELENKNFFMPRWSGNSKSLYLLSYKKGNVEFNRYNIEKNLIEKIFETYGTVYDYLISSDEKFIIFSKKIFPECGIDEQCLKLRDSLLDNGPIQAYLSDELLFRHWDSYTEGRVSQLFIYDINSKKLNNVYECPYDIPETTLGGDLGFSVSSDGSLLAFTSKMLDNPAESTNNDVYIYNFTKNELINLTEKNKAWDGYPLISPDGNYIAYKFHDRSGFESDRYTLAIFDLKKNVLLYSSAEIDNNVKDIIWSANSKSIYFSVEEKGYTSIYNYNVEKKKIEKLLNKSLILSFSLSPDETFILYTASRVDIPVEIYKYDFKTKKEERLTKVNLELTEKVDFRPAEELWIKSNDGTLIHTFIVKPYNFDPRQKYPLILNVHGGPQMMWRNSYRADWQIYPGHGYIIAFPNPRGSTGYGQKFTDEISGDWGGKVYNDLMAVVDSLEKLPFVDKERIGAMGWSFGGYMMNWFQAKTKRFKCLVSMMGIFDLPSFYGTTEELWFPEWDLKGAPWNSEDYKKFNPAEYFENFSTPTLIITGKKDYRVSYTQSVHYFTYLQKKRIPSRLIIFKEEGHWPNHIKAMPLYYNAHLEWFHKYLGGKPAPFDSKVMSRNLHLIKTNEIY
jgi:dipeptidyl aminopeptidase/acylaminoacyl peptidase